MRGRRVNPRSTREKAEALDRLLKPIFTGEVQPSGEWFPVARLAEAAQMNLDDAKHVLRASSHSQSALEMRDSPAQGWHLRFRIDRFQDKRFLRVTQRRVHQAASSHDLELRALARCVQDASIQNIAPLGELGQIIASKSVAAACARVKDNPEAKAAILEAFAEVQVRTRNVDTSAADDIER